jgi:GT2 family glycosyltransferase
VSIIIPFKDKPELLRQCLDSILDKSTYSHFEIIGISNNSTELETDRLMRHYEKLDSRIKFQEYNIPFNFSAINNYAVRFAKGEHLVLLNNDIEIISPDWIEALLQHSQRPEVGAVGAKLYFPNDTIQHAGVIIGIGGVAAHSHKYSPRESAGYYFRPKIIGNISAVTAACLMVKKSIYEEVGGLEEKHLKVAFNDVDFCLRLREKGYLNIYTPYCEAYHHESISRGYEDTPEKKIRFAAETRYMKKRHAEILKRGDPYYNPNLTLDSEDFRIREDFNLRLLG